MHGLIGSQPRVQGSASWKLWLLWLAAALVVPIWAANDSTAWDLRIYGQALQSLQAHHDPYQDATNIQKRVYAVQAADRGSAGAVVASNYSYVYSPITLLPLRLLGHLSRTLLIALYWLLYSLGCLGAIAACVSLSTTGERKAMLCAAAFAPFLPGLLSNEAILSGNIAYILYGAILGALVLGWRKDTWWCFYVVVWMAACIKAPMISLALLPALSARRQWLPSLASVAAGAIMFGLQPVLWPTLFRHYLEAVELQFSINQDFGASPAGLFSQALVRHGLPYAPAGYFLFLAYAIPIFAALVFFSRCYLRGEIPLKQWAPVLLVGVIMLNPRIMEYDAAPITIPLALIAWRLAADTARPRVWLAVGGCALLLMNAAAIANWQLRKAIDGPLVILLLAGGMVDLLRQSRRNRRTCDSPDRWGSVDVAELASATSTHLPAAS